MGRYPPRRAALDQRSREGQSGEVAFAVAAATPAVDNIPWEGYGEEGG